MPAVELSTREARMQYSSSIPFEGDSGRAFDLALAALTGVGFRAVLRDDARLELVGPGMNSTRESPLAGASFIRLRRGVRELTLEAELGGTERMARFVTWFPIGLSVMLAAVLMIVFRQVMPNGLWQTPVMMVAGGNMLLWMILSPWMARRIYLRTCRGLESLLQAASIGP
jgi:hypothetical protein